MFISCIYDENIYLQLFSRKNSAQNHVVNYTIFQIISNIQKIEIKNDYSDNNPYFFINFDNVTFIKKHS